MTDPVFFETGAQFRAWLTEHQAAETELVVGFWKPRRASRRRVDDQSYTIRLTPRRVGSIWSAANVAKAETLTAAGLMTPAGLAAFAQRRADRTAF